MAKTIRSHPTSHILVLEPFFLDYSYIFKMWTQKGPTFSSFSHLPTCKKTTPQRKKDAHGPSLHIRFLSTCDFWDCIYNVLSICSKKITFLILHDQNFTITWKYRRDFLPSSSWGCHAYEILLRNAHGRQNHGNGSRLSICSLLLSSRLIHEEFQLDTQIWSLPFYRNSYPIRYIRHRS